LRMIVISFHKTVFRIKNIYKQEIECWIRLLE